MKQELISDEGKALDPVLTLRKMAVTAAQIGLGVAASKTQGALTGVGISIPQEYLIIAFSAVIRGVCNILKTKAPRIFGWL